MGDEEDAAPARKVFVLNAGEYIGKVLCKRFLASEDEKFEILGTLRSGAQKPSWVKRVVDTSPEALLAAFRECELTVLDCLNAMDGAEALLEAISGVKEFEDEKVLVGISSVMTWTRTTPDAEEPEKALTEEEYKRRRPHSSFKELLALEKLVTKSKRTGLRTHVVAAGLVYGQDEDLFHDLFKTAWSCKPLTLASIGDGGNLLPTIHVADLCSVVLKLLEADSLPYLLAVDQGQAQEEAAQTLKAVVEKLSVTLGMGGVGVMPPEQVRLQKDYEFFQAGIRLDGAAVGEMGFEWQCQEGMLAHMDKVVQEYRESRGLLPLRVLVHGNDDLAKTALAASLAAEYKVYSAPSQFLAPSSAPSPCVTASSPGGLLDTKKGPRPPTLASPRPHQVPHIVAAEALEAAKAGDDALAAELKAAVEPMPDALIAKALTAALSTTACKNQGYFLQGFPERLEQAAALFGAGGGEAGEEAAEEEPEEGAEALAAPPELVLVLEAEDEVVKQKLLAQPSLGTTEEVATTKLAAYATNNAEDSPTSVLGLKALAGVEPLHFAVEADTATGAMAAKARVYLGAPRNYGPTEEELASKAAVVEAAARKAASEEAATAQAQADEEADEKKRREAHDSRRMAELQQQERELLEVRAIPLRNYLMQNVIPTLTEGLIEVCKLKPDDPVDYLAEWLFKNNPIEEDHFE